jgi:twitching motility two-component system response regulator PilH
MRQKLLIADDNRAITEVLKMNFDLLGYDVLVAVDGEDAEQKIVSFKPDLMILDVMMPKKNGYKVCRDLKKEPALSRIPIILLTAKNLKEDVYWGYDCGADAYITKPYDPRQLELLVDQLIKEAASGRRATAWTGLPDASRVVAEHKARLEAGAPSTMIRVYLSREPAEAFGRKYGVPRLKDLIHQAAWKIHEILPETTSAGVLGQDEEDRFLVVLHPEEVAPFENMVTDRVSKLILGAYDDADREKGHLALKEPEDGGEKSPFITCAFETIKLKPE